MTSMKTVLITGAASGIGEATARLFAEKGWYVGLFDIDTAGLERLAGDLKESCCCRGPLDVSDGASVRRAIDFFVEKTGGRFDLLFNNAGILKAGFFDELSIEEQLRVVDVNLKGLLQVTHAALPHLARTPGARVISMSSASSVYGTAHLAAYSATKAAVSSLTESLNMELERLGIRVSDIRVPYVRTPLLDTPTRAASLNTLGARLTPRDAAELVYASLGRRAIHVDGRGMGLLLLLRRLAPMAIQKKILKYIMMP
ncbi:SDR family oxidoreductase [Desulfatiferula olefinivorans]